MAFGSVHDFVFLIVNKKFEFGTSDDREVISSNWSRVFVQDDQNQRVFLQFCGD